MPARIFEEIRRRDSIRHLKDTSYLLEKGYLKTTKDTTGIEDEDEDSVTLDKYKKIKQEDSLLNNTVPSKKNSEQIKNRPEAALPEKERKRDTSIKKRI